MKIQLKHSNVVNTGVAQQPTAGNMLEGELALNINASDPAIFIKNSNGDIVRIAGKDNLAFTGYQTAIPAAATPPSDLVEGNLYFDTDDNRLYYYYNNGSTTQWVDASTEKFDVSIIPDASNLSHQSGTLDTRYVNSNGDTMTGNLQLNAGVNVNSSDIYLNNGKVIFEGANANAHEIRLTVNEPTADRVVSIPDTTGTLVSTGDSGTVTSAMIADGTIVNSDVSNSAAIGLSKLGTGSLPTGITVSSSNIVDGTIVNADISSSAGISLSKLASGELPAGITFASSAVANAVSANDLGAGALPNNVTVTSTNIVDGSIVNADISNTAEIQVGKLADGNSYQLLQTNAAGSGVEWTSNIDVPGTLDVTGNSTFDGNANVAGNFTVAGSTVSLDANIVTVKDNNLTLGVVSTPNNTTANGGGFTVKGDTDKTFNWSNSTGSWTSSENVDIAAGKAYYANGSAVLSQTTLGSSVLNSSLTGLGTISTGIWQGTPITDAYLATISGSGKVANSATTATNLNSGNAIVGRDASGDFIARNITASLIGNASTATTLQNVRTITLGGDLSGSATFNGSSDITISATVVSGGGDGTTNLSYTASSREIASDTGTNVVLPLFNSTTAGLTGASGGGTINFLRADGSWAVPTGGTDLSYTASTKTLNSSTGQNIALPEFNSFAAGLVPASGGGTTKFLRADGLFQTLTSGGGGTDLGYVSGTRTITSTTGTSTALPEVAADGDSGLMTGADKTKLDGISTGAEVNAVTSVNGQTGAITVSSYTNAAAISAVTGSDLDMNGNKVLFANVYSNLSDLPSASTYHGMFAHVHSTGKGYFAHAGNWVELATLTNGKLTSTEIPDIAITEYLGSVANQSAMLALTGQKGDWAIRTDDGKVYVITGTDPTNLSDWASLSYPAVPNTDLGYTASTRVISSSTGTDTTLPLVTAGGDAGLITGADKTKLDGIEASATADQTDAEIKSAYENNSNTNVFTDAEKTKLAGVDTGAEVNAVTSVNGQTGAVTIAGTTNLSYTASTRELASSTGANTTLPNVSAGGNSGLMTGSDKSKLDGIASGAQVNTVTSVNGQTGAVTISGSTDLTYTAATRVIASSTGTNATIPHVIAGGNSGLMTGGDKTKIDIFDEAIIKHPQAFTSSRTIAANTNAAMMGPVVTINGGVVFTIEDNSVFNIIT